MKRILGSLSLLFGIGLLAIGATGAFFSDSEVSSANTFAAGAIDLKIDNHGYYNHNECKNVGSAEQPVYQWVGDASFPVSGSPCSDTWELTDLTIQKFFDFTDLKPGDTGEDTISLHVNNNDAYMCANVKLTSNDDNGLTEPEAIIDPTDGAGQGELASNVNFVWWADDGDNVLEDNESVISQGPIGALGLNGSTTIPLADSQNNIWTGVPGPAPGDETLYIGKAWCFGNIGALPLAQDGLGTTSPRTPANSTGGITCDGHLLDNSTQTDSLTADVTFTAVQARHNEGFLCVPPVRETGELTVVKIVKNDNGGNNIVSDFHLNVDDGFVSTGVLSGATTTLPVGNYTVNETGVAGYVASFSGDCDVDGNVTINNGDHKTCILTNDDLPANITLIKNVINHGGTATPTQFGLRVDGFLVQNNTSTSTSSNVPHTINETGKAGYHFVGPITGTSSYGKSCPAVLNGSVTLDEGEAITCTITNEQNQ